MKSLLLILAVLAVTTFSRADVAADLDALKQTIPVPAGKIQDPMITDMVNKYTRAIQSITPATIPQNVKMIRTQLERDLAQLKTTSADLAKSNIGVHQSKATGAQYAATKKMIVWLEKKVSPFVDKIEALEQKT